VLSKAISYSEGKRIKKMTEKQIYAVREQLQTSSPEEQGPRIKQFQTFREAQVYGSYLFTNYNIKSYISLSEPLSQTWISHETTEKGLTNG